jgi:tetratricopeptide (TPR) repeat protein
MRPSQLTLTISTAGIILAVLGLYFGAFLPLLKAQSFISADRRLANVKSVDGFKENFDISFNLYSPVGTEEISKFLGSNVMNIIAQGQPEDVSRELITYTEGHLFKDEVRHLLLLAQMYQMLWENYHQEADYQKAIDYLEKAHEIGPNLPPPLYKLLNLYLMHGDKENSKRIGALILANWPQDENVKAVLGGN